MEAIRDDTIGAFNAYLEGLKRRQPPIDFTLVQFDSDEHRQDLCAAGRSLRFRGSTRDTYQPRASTPLIDAAYKTIKAVEDSLPATPRPRW